MPHARIDMYRALAPQMPDISAAILRGMVTGFEMPADDFFQAFRLHDPGELFSSPPSPTSNATTSSSSSWSAEGLQRPAKQGTMEAVVDEVSALGIKRDDLLLVINEVGQGATWYAPAPV